MSQNITFAFAFQIEIGVLRQIDRSCFVGRGQIVDRQFVGIRPFVGDLALAGYPDNPPLCLWPDSSTRLRSNPSNDRFRVPNHFVEADHATVQVIGPLLIASV